MFKAQASTHYKGSLTRLCNALHTTLCFFFAFQLVFMCLFFVSVRFFHLFQLGKQLCMIMLARLGRERDMATSPFRFSCCYNPMMFAHLIRCAASARIPMPTHHFQISALLPVPGNHLGRKAGKGKNATVSRFK